MKKVLLLIDDLGQGGAERQMVYLASELKKEDCEVRLIKFFPGPTPYASLLKEQSIDYEIIEQGRNRWRRVWEILKLVRNWKPDLTIVYKDGSCIASCLVRLLYKFKLVVSERNTTQKLTIYEKIKFFLFQFADFIVPNSKSQSNFIKLHYPKLTDKVITITNMVDLERFYPALVRPSRKTVIITARLTPQKNVINFLEALKVGNFDKTDVHFDWYGKIHEKAYYDSITAKKDELKLDDIITFHTNGSDSIEEVYRRATHFCLPSLYEGFPNVLCEAMASGLICVASDVSDNKDILGDSDFLFDPKNHNDMASKLKYALDLKETEERAITKKNWDKILNLCGAKTFVEKYLSLLK